MNAVKGNMMPLQRKGSFLWTSAEIAIASFVILSVIGLFYAEFLWLMKQAKAWLTMLLTAKASFVMVLLIAYLATRLSLIGRL